MSRKLKLLDLFGALFKLKEQCINLSFRINGEMLKDYGKIVESYFASSLLRRATLQRIEKNRLQRNSSSEREY